MKMKSVFLIFSFLTLPFTSLADDVKIDSLLNLFKGDLEDTTSVNILNELSWEYHRNDLKKSYDYANDALKEATRIGFEKGAARAHNLMAIIYSMKGEINLSINANLKCLEIARRINSLYHISIATNDLGISFSQLGDNDKALKYYQESLEIAVQTNDTLGICFTLSNIGRLHYDESNYDLAASYYKQVIDIGILASNKMVLGMSYANLGYLEADMGNFKNARDYFYKAKEIAKAIGDRLSHIEMQIAIADLDVEEKRYELAEAEFKTIITDLKDFGLHDGMSIYPHYALTDLYRKQNKYNQSIDAALLGLKYSEELADINYQVSFHQSLAEIYEEENQITDAFKHYKIYKVLSDSIYSKEKSDKVMELESKYQLKEKSLENELLKEAQQKGEILLKQKNLINYFSFFFLLVLVGGVFLLWKRYRKKKNYSDQLEAEVQSRTKDLLNSNQRLIESNKELERFAYIASHDLKEPLRNISGFSRLIDRSLKDVDKPRVKEYLSFVKSNALQMHSLIEDVLEYSRLTKGSRLEKVDANKILDDVKASLDPIIKEKNVLLTVDPLPEMISNKTQLFQVFKNLIENGIKYNESAEIKIKVGYEKKDGQHCLSVQDNGIGIEAEYQSQVFEMFKRLHNRSEYQGSGLGLAIVKKIVEGLQGDIKLESSPGYGSVFYLEFPLEVKEKKSKVFDDLSMSQ